jgi:hypothetical protein
MHPALLTAASPVCCVLLFPLQVITLDMGLLVAGTKYRGEFEERLKKLMDEIKQNDDIILVRIASFAALKAGSRHGHAALVLQQACQHSACLQRILMPIQDVKTASAAPIAVALQAEREDVEVAVQQLFSGGGIAAACIGLGEQRVY